MIYLLLFWEFAKVAIFCVGGGYASMPLIQAAVVDTYHWMSLSEFVDIFTISQMTPGPIGINAATFAGQKIAGFPGAVCATVGFCTPSLIIGIALTRLFFSYGDIGAIRGVLNGLRPAVVALIAAAGISFVVLALWNTETLPADLTTIDPIGVLILAGSLVAVRRKIGVIRILAGTGIIGLLLGVAREFL
ncbi:chromate transporter [Selenomonas sp. GACV-9]|uniref:chromate transporter n=1 Tax=Selenomonas sp. GACV-9 TaxID=3158782 RepID=UPI0008E69394|nr:chromate transporter [Selenomonas ruminantium]